MPARLAVLAAALLLALVALPVSLLSPVLAQGPDAGALAARPVQRSGAPASACTVVVTETVGFDPLRLCSAEPVTVTLGLSCPVRLPLHVVFVVGVHLAMQDSLEEVK